MKKKIKDLTLQEEKNICDKYNGENFCVGCPLDTKKEDYCKSDYLDKYGDEEIEVDLDEEKD